MAEMTPEEVRAYLTRWELVQEVEVAELRRTPLDTKLRQLEALFASRDVFVAEPNREIETKEVWERWTRLRQVLSA
jgi:hypothetical protein